MAQTVSNWLTGHGLSPEFAIFVISLMPILELRGGLIAAALLKLTWFKSFVICFIGNIIPVPFILLFVKKILGFMKKWKPTAKIAEFFEHRANKNVAKSEGKTGWGKIIFVYLFVAIPLPGTGAWTGSLVASFMDMKLKHSIPAIICGVLTAGAIMSIICYAAPTLSSQLFGFSF